MTDLTHLDRLEAESIHIMREVAAECENPVMLYSVGKDSSVMLPAGAEGVLSFQAAIPADACRYDWKFREMIKFRDDTAKKHGLELIVHINEDGVREGVGPISHGSAVHTDIMKTQSLKQGAR